MGSTVTIVLLSVAMAKGESSIISQFEQQESLSGLSCLEDEISFTEMAVSHISICLSLCSMRDDCASVFFASHSSECRGCTFPYNSMDVSTEDFNGSLYYEKVILGYEYVECYTDCQNDVHLCSYEEYRIMDHSWGVGTRARIETCYWYCKGLDMTYFGIQNSRTCWCSDGEYDIFGLSTACTEPCLGDSSQICGGHAAMSVYRVSTDTEG